MATVYAKFTADPVPVIAYLTAIERQIKAGEKVDLNAVKKTAGEILVSTVRVTYGEQKRNKN